MSQLFKKDIDIDIKLITDFLDKYANKTNKYYILNKISYKKALFNKDIQKFYDDIKPYYHKSKLFYVDRVINYKNFITVIRQLLKYKNLPIISNIKYMNGSYELYYNIYYNIL